MRQFGLCSYCRCLEPARARTSENFFTSLTITPADIALLQVIYGLLVGVFNGFAAGSVEVAEFRSKISTFSLYYVYLSIGLFVFTYAATVGFYWSGERIVRALRIAYLSAVLRQNMAFFDVLRPGDISNRIMSDMGILQEAITSKTSTMLSAIATFLCGLYRCICYVLEDGSDTQSILRGHAPNILCW